VRTLSFANPISSFIIRTQPYHATVHLNGMASAGSDERYLSGKIRKWEKKIFNINCFQIINTKVHMKGNLICKSSGMLRRAYW